MSCSLAAPSHYRSVYWLLVSVVLWYSPASNFTASAETIILYNAFENQAFEITATSLKGQLIIVNSLLPVQITAASSSCTQLCCPHPLWEQSDRLLSSPSHSTLSSKIGPSPLPKWAQDKASPPVNPNCLHATSASACSHLQYTRPQNKDGGQNRYFNVDNPSHLTATGLRQFNDVID